MPKMNKMYNMYVPLACVCAASGYLKTTIKKQHTNLKTER